jgi:hypothetical protein
MMGQRVRCGSTSSRAVRICASAGIRSPSHWQRRCTGVPGGHAVIEAQVREWCEQVLVEVVLAARNSTRSQEQLDALLSPTSFTAALLPRHLLHAMLQKRLAQKLGAPRTGTSR